jgi:hypothetical protein
MSKIEVGQKVFIKRYNYNRNNIDIPAEYEVEKVGNKYFYVKQLYRTKFSIDEMRDISEYSSHYNVYLSMQEYELELDYNKKLREVNEYFSRYNKPTHEQLNIIYKTLF